MVNATTITATTPAHAAGAASVLVTTPGGTNTANTLFTYLTAPTVTSNTANLAINAPTITIAGTGFDTTVGNNTVTFSSGTGVVTSATATSLTVTFSGAPSLGNLTAAVTSFGGTSGTAVQVATIVAAPTVSSNTANLAINAPTITIAGTGFDTTAGNNTVTFSSGTGVVTSATATSLTVTFSGAPSSGNLTAAVTSFVETSGTAVQMATIFGIPTVNSISPNIGSLSGGTPITITGNNLTGTTVVTIGGIPATDVTVVNATTITATTPAGSVGTASVLVTTPGGTNAANTLFTFATAPLVTGTPTAPSSSSGASTVNLYNAVTGQPTGTAVPFPGFNGPVKVVSGDFNSDGVAEIVAGAGFGGGPAVAILDSQTGEVMNTFFAFDPSFTGAIFVAVQDVNNDGILDIIASAGPGGGPEVRFFDGTSLNVLRSFFAYAEDFTGGVSVASVDFNNDGILDLVTGAGPGGAPHVKVFDGATNAIISQWYAYPVSFTGGVFVAAGDIGNDGSFEVVTGAGPTGAPVVAVWNPFTGALLSQFMAYAEGFTGGVRVAVTDGNGDGFADLVTGAGPSGGPHVKAFSFPALDLLFSFYSGESTDKGGVFVG